MSDGISNLVRSSVRMTDQEKQDRIPDYEPEAGNYIWPAPAGKKMRAAQYLSQTVYIFGVSGCGKTAFIRSFMGKRSYLYFSARHLKEEDLQIASGRKLTIVVIDDLHLLRNDELKDALTRSIEELAGRSDIWLVLSGRCRIPPWLTPVYYRRVFAIIEEKDFLLSKEDITKYLSAWNLTPTDEDLDKIIHISFGIGIVVRLIAIEMQAGVPFDAAGIEKMRGRYLDYMDHHVYNQWDLDIHDFLMQVCIVDEFDRRLAEMITGRNDVGKMIGLAEQLGCFLSRKETEGNKVIYEIRFSMRKAMRRRLMRMYPNERWERLYYNAGLYYELTDDTPNALKMYQTCHDMERIADLLVANARKNPASGHYYELREYYLGLPDDRIRESIELMAGMSMLQALLLNVEESERWYGELLSTATTLSGSAAKAARGKLVYLDIALPQRRTMTLPDILKSAAILMTNRSISLPEFSITSNLPSQLNGGKDFCAWTRKDRELANRLGKALELVMGKYGKGLINLGLAESFLEKGGDSYEISNLANKGMMQAQAGGKIEQCFVASAILAWLNVLNNHADDARELLASFRKRVLQEGAVRLLPNLTTLEIRVGLYQGKTSEAMDWLEQTPDEEVEFSALDRYCFLAKARIYLMTGRYERAINLLQRLLYYADVMDRCYIRMEAGLLMAIARYRMEDPVWEEIFAQVMTEAESYHFVRLISREGAAVNRMLRETTWTGNNTDYLGAVTAETEKMAKAYPGYLKIIAEEASLCENAIRILKLQAEGLTTAEIAGELALSVENIKYHNKQNFKKLGVKSKTAAVIEAQKRKLI